MDTLELRRLKSDLSMYYKILHKLVDLDQNSFFRLALNQAATRGNLLKLLKPHCRSNFQLHYFQNRAINVWNSLSSETVLQPNFQGFKRKLNSTPLQHFCLRYNV